jgi:hypothetical protein
MRSECGGGNEPGMAVQVKARSSELYERDLYAWSEFQADLLRRRRFAELDLEHMIEKIKDVGGSLHREVRARIRTIIEHLLKLEHSAATEPRAGWERTIRTKRADLAEDLTPSLRPRIERSLARFYDTARIEAAAALHAHNEHAAADALPTIFPYTLDQIIGKWLPNQGSGAKKRGKIPDSFVPPRPAAATGNRSTPCPFRAPERDAAQAAQG